MTWVRSESRGKACKESGPHATNPACAKPLCVVPRVRRKNGPVQVRRPRHAVVLPTSPDAARAQGGLDETKSRQIDFWPRCTRRVPGPRGCAGGPRRRRQKSLRAHSRRQTNPVQRPASVQRPVRPAPSVSWGRLRARHRMCCEEQLMAPGSPSPSPAPECGLCQPRGHPGAWGLGRRAAWSPCEFYWGRESVPFSCGAVGCIGQRGDCRFSHFPAIRCFRQFHAIFLNCLWASPCCVIVCDLCS